MAFIFRDLKQITIDHSFGCIRRFPVLLVQACNLLTNYYWETSAVNPGGYVTDAGLQTDKVAQQVSKCCTLWTLYPATVLAVPWRPRFKQGTLRQGQIHVLDFLQIYSEINFSGRHRGFTSVLFNLWLVTIVERWLNMVPDECHTGWLTGANRPSLPVLPKPSLRLATWRGCVLGCLKLSSMK